MKAILTILSLCFCLSGWGQQKQKVLLIGMDGCRSDVLRTAETPNIDQIIQNGIYSPDAMNTDITISGPGWSAILCGVWSDKHLVTGNDFSLNNYAEFPSIFKYIESHDADLNTVSICNWGPINDHIVVDDADIKMNVGSDEEVADMASSYLLDNEVDFMFLHFDEIDHAGHAHGFSKDVPEYLTIIEMVDMYVGIVMEALQSRSNYAEEDWLIMLTTDHGGLGFSHGGNSFAEQNVFFIVSGSSVDQTLITRDSSVVEIENCLGDIASLQFDETNQYGEITEIADYNYKNGGDFTVECRVKTNSSGDYAIVGNKDWNSGLNPGFVFSFKYPSGPEWKVNIGDGDSRVDINTGGEIADGQWHSLAVSFDRDGYMKTYQDGTLLDSADISHIADLDVGEGLFLGTDINGNYSYPGGIAELRLWNMALSAEEINEWHCKSLSSEHNNYESLAGYWPIDEGEGSELTDHSLAQNHGVLTGGNWQDNLEEVVYDYSQTPRLVDIPVTALNHMCIPVDTEWQLDGRPYVENCISASDDVIQRAQIKIWPNPNNGTFMLQLDETLSGSKNITIINRAGISVYQSTVQESIIEIHQDQLVPGMYFLNVETPTSSSSKYFVISR